MANRWRINVAYRAQVRLYELSALRRRDGRLNLKRALAGVAVDVGVATALRRSTRPLVGVRLLVDALDAAVWGRDIPSPPETPTLVSVPLALEAGARYGWGGLVVPAANWAVLALARRGTGRRTPVQTMGWQVVAVGAAWLLDRYEAVQRRTTEQRARQEAGARTSSAFLAGQNEVAMGADTVVDELGRVEHVLASLSPESQAGGTGRALAAWKASLAEATVVDTIYLGTLLTRWERARRGPDLSADVVLDLPPGLGTTVLSSGQAAWLTQALDALGLRGRVPLSMPTGDRRVPGDAVELRIGGRRIVIPADEGGPRRPVDPRPVVLVGGFWWALSSMSASHGHVPLRRALPPASLSVALAAWARSRLDRQETSDHRVLLAALVTAGIQAVTISRGQRELYNSDGFRQLPIQLSLAAPAMYLAVSTPPSTPAERIEATSLAAAVIAAGLAAARPPRPRRDVLSAMTWPIAAYEAVHSITGGLDRANESRRDELVQLSRTEVERAWLAGRNSVLDLVESSWRTACERLAEGRSGEHPWLDEEMAAELTRRLDSAKGQLDALRWAES